MIASNLLRWNVTPLISECQGNFQMIERQEVDGRQATVCYFNDDFETCEPDEATLVKVVFDDGEVAFLTPADGDEGELN